MVGSRSYKIISKKMKYAGLSINPIIFIYMRLVSCIILFILSLFLCNYGYLVAPIISLIYYYFIEYVVIDLQIGNRKIELEDDALEYFPVLLLCLKGNNNVKKAISLTNDVVNNSLSKEFKKVINNVKIGKSLDESLSIMKDTIPSNFIINIIISLIEANRMGNSISNTIVDQLDYIEDKRRKKIIKYHRLMPLKVALVSIIFVFSILLFLIFCSI